MAKIDDDHEHQNERILISLRKINLEQLQQTLQCGICHGLFNEPVTLFCNHTYCHSCLIILEKDYDNCRKCPVCEVKIWEPSIKTVNYVIRDVVKQLFGEDKYQADYEERQKILLKVDIKAEVAQEIKDEMWRSIADSLHKEQVKKEKGTEEKQRNILDNILGLSPKQSICHKFNSIYGCDKEECNYKHEADATMLMKTVTDLREKYGYLFTLDKVCAEFNTIKGCQLGEACDRKHIPHVTTLVMEINKYKGAFILKEEEIYFYKCLIIALIIIAIFMFCFDKYMLTKISR